MIKIHLKQKDLKIFLCSKYYLTYSSLTGYQVPKYVINFYFIREFYRAEIRVTG